MLRHFISRHCCSIFISCISHFFSIAASRFSKEMVSSLLATVVSVAADDLASSIGPSTGMYFVDSPTVATTLLATELAGLETEQAGCETGLAGHETDLAGLETEQARRETVLAGHETELAGLETEQAGHETGLAGHETEQAGLDTS